MSNLDIPDISFVFRLFPESSALSIPEHGMEAGNQGDSSSKRIYFAAGVYKGESWHNLSWVAKNFPGHKICLLHVLQPSHLAPFSRFARGIERETVKQNLKKYHLMLRDIGLEVEEVYIKMERVEEGIVKLISQHGIKNLVMGAAARKMVYVESKVTKYVSDKGSAFCQIWFLHKGNLIKTRYEQAITGGESVKETYEEYLMREKAEKEHVEAACKVRTAEMEIKDANATPVVATPTRISTAPSVLVGYVDEELHERLREAMLDASNAKREASEESLRRQKAEKDAVEAARRAEAAEKMHNDETRNRRENEDAILMHKQKLENMSSQLVRLMEELNNTLRKKSLLENEIAESKTNIDELRDKIVSYVRMLLGYKNEQDGLKVTRDHAFRAAEVLKLQAESAKSSASLTQFLSEFSYSEIGNATCYFHHSLKIDERGSWSIYKGLLHHTEVAIKMLNGDCSRGPSEYRLEVDALSRLRHQNIVTMIGVCPEALAIIYEYLPNGSLEDRLNCKDNSSPLPWQTRIRIAFELCSALIFLHSSKPQSYVHGALHPSNIHLDANFTAKLSHFGNCRAITTAPDSTLKSYVNGLGNDLMKMIMQRTASEESSHSHSITNVASCPYMDPESVITGETSPQLDVYAFGIIILRLLTGKEACGIIRKVERALDYGFFSDLLDSSAGDWPYLLAQQLAQVALRCTDMNKENRPDLKSEVIEVLRTMKDSCQGSSKAHPGQDSQREPPQYYICPINQEIMRNPNVAADGFTYEAEAIQGWIERGHKTSPMTNLTMAHTNLVPNLALRSAIEEWLHRQ